MENNIEYTLNPKKLLDYFDRNGLFLTVAIAVVGNCFSEISNEIFNKLLLPIINKEDKNDRRLEDKKITICGVEFEFGKIMIVFLRTIATIYIIYIMFYFIKKIIIQSGKNN